MTGKWNLTDGVGDDHYMIICQSLYAMESAEDNLGRMYQK